MRRTLSTSECLRGALTRIVNYHKSSREHGVLEWTWKHRHGLEESNIMEDTEDQSLIRQRENPYSKNVHSRQRKESSTPLPLPNQDLDPHRRVCGPAEKNICSCAGLLALYATVMAPTVRYDLLSFVRQLCAGTFILLRILCRTKQGRIIKVS